MQHRGVRTCRPPRLQRGSAQRARLLQTTVAPSGTVSSIPPEWQPPFRPLTRGGEWRAIRRLAWRGRHRSGANCQDTTMLNAASYLSPMVIWIGSADRQTGPASGSPSRRFRGTSMAPEFGRRGSKCGAPVRSIFIGLPPIWCKKRTGRVQCGVCTAAVFISHEQARSFRASCGI